MKHTVLITGGSGGIGFALAEQFAAHGDSVLLAASNAVRLEEAKTNLEKKHGASVSVYTADLAVPGGAETLYRTVCADGKRVDILVNNAGFGDYAEFVESDWEKQERMVTLNITTLMHLCRLFGAEMKARRSGRILNIASCAAFSAGPYMSVYYASKAFVLSFSQAIDEELREYGVTVTALCLGPTSTHFTETAEMHGSTMFKKIKPDTPEAVAKTGYRAVMQGRCVKFHGVPTKMMSVAVRFSPRILSRRFAKNINAKPPASFSGKTEGK
ncbi:MAG: SDR family NAD(P)-dependent oxidoreductase [Eubacteriales bacterium]